MSKHTTSIIKQTKFKNKYRTTSIRLKNWNYATRGYYFITICTKNRKCYFGNILDKKMQLSKIGKIANAYWQEIPEHFPFTTLDKFIVMPNHIHGIVIINNNVETQNLANNVNNVETQNLASLRQNKGNKFGPQSQNLASIIRGLKIGVKKWATINNIPFQWQPRFYDHIVRNERSLHQIRQYIVDNPSNWENDRDNLENLYI